MVNFLKSIFSANVSEEKLVQKNVCRIRAVQEEKLFVAESEKVLAKSKAADKTNRNTKTALRSFKKFLDGKDMPIGKMDKLLMAKYEQWLLTHVNKNTSALYMRSLRAMYNKIVKRCKKGIFSEVRTSSCRSESIKPIEKSDIRKLASFESADEKEQMARDMFLFSFYCMGMPFVDVYHLKQQQIHGDVLSYHRNKTGVEVKVGLCKEANEILSRYRESANEYVFPLQGRNGVKAYDSALREYNSLLSQIEEKVGLQGHLSSYVVRHTWATMAYSETCDVNIVAGGLGHSNTQVTRTYISSILNKKLLMTNRKLIKKVLT